MPTIHRTAVFTLPQPTHQARVKLERAFRDYTHAVTTLLHVAWARYGQPDDLVHGRTTGLDALRGLATSALDAKTGAPRLTAQHLGQFLYRRGGPLSAHPAVQEALTRLPSRLRQSAIEIEAGQTLMSYVALADAWLLGNPQQRGGAPQFPRRARPHDASAQYTASLGEVVTLADDQRHERQVVARVLLAREPTPVAISFVGVADAYGCALYWYPATASYAARLDIGATDAHDAAPLAHYGVYTQIKTGERWASETHLRMLREQGADTTGIQSFGRATGRLWLPIKLDEIDGNPTKRDGYHVRALRFTHTAFLPNPAMPASGIVPAEPVSAKLVRQQTQQETGSNIWYQLHVVFALPPEALDPADGVATDARPLLAINRGLLHLYAAALMTPDGRREIATFAAGGRDLLARQAAMGQLRAQQQARGKQPHTRRDRRQSRVADHEINVCANQIVEVARRERAQVVLEDLTTFATGAAVRVTRQSSHWAQRAPALRTLLNRRQFEALHQAVDQRLALVGLPPARVVNAAYISQTCVACGQRDARPLAERRAAVEQAGETYDPRVLTCSSCGASRDVDALAAVNIARKLVWLRVRGDEKRAGRAEGDRTPWDEWVRRLCASR